ncbi:MAG TPA: diadenylate cyclase CdaA [Gemmatimonadales bacterium]|nr:diadenylate cyclase CdaA [Gemmatimonadales bacterium]
MPLDYLRFLVPGWRDLIEILIVAAVMYQVLRFLAGTRALPVMLGLIGLAVIYFAALLLQFDVVTTMLGLVFTYGVFAAIVVFQPELRHALTRLGRVRALGLIGGADDRAVSEEIADAVRRLVRAGTGGIIAVEGDVALSDYLETGTEMNATVSADLLATIFTRYSPLHDGAVLIRRDQIIGAGCVLPLTQFPVTDRSLGTRHRAALGLSEETDAVVLVISEETSQVAAAVRGLLRRGLTEDEVREVLTTRSLPAAPADLPAGERV